jgi:hypothetical protein
LIAIEDNVDHVFVFIVAVFIAVEFFTDKVGVVGILSPKSA